MCPTLREYDTLHGKSTAGLNLLRGLDIERWWITHPGHHRGQASGSSFAMPSSLTNAGAGWHSCAQEQGSAQRKPERALLTEF